MTKCQLIGNTAISSKSGAIFIGYYTAAVLTQCTFSGNKARVYGGAIYADLASTLSLTQCTFSGNNVSGNGGAIYAESTLALNLTQCVLSENVATNGDGGAICITLGKVALTECVLSGNSATNKGAAIYNNFGTVTLMGCSLSGNAAASAGAVFNTGDRMTLKRCTLANNTATVGYGGAIYADGGDLNLTQCTICGNTAGGVDGYGGAIFNSDSLVLNHCTLYGNKASISGGGIVSARSLTMTNSIVAGNAADSGADIYGIDGAATHTEANLIGNNDSASTIFPAGLPNANGDYVGTDSAPLEPRLAPLGNYGGTTQTMALLPSSLARNHANPSPSITVDQRGYPVIGNPDIGAYENQFGVLTNLLVIPFGTSSKSVLCNLGIEGEVSAISSDTSIIPDTGINITGDGLSRTVTVRPAGRIGRATLTLTQSPSGETDTLEVYVLPENYAEPSISDIRDETTLEDAGTLVIPFTVTETTDAFALTISVTLSNTSLVPDNRIIVGGSGVNRSLSVTPVADWNGTTTITVTVSDGVATTKASFLLTVSPVNDVPAFTKGLDQTQSSEFGAQSVNNWAFNPSNGPANESAQVLRFIVENNNNALFTAQPAISSDGTLTYTPVAGAEGMATVSVRLKDDGGTANGGVDTSAVQTFTITLVSARTPTVVTSTADSGPGTLRQIVAVAAAKPGTDVISFASELSGQTITLANQIPVRDTSGVIIDASALPNGLTISGNNLTRIFIQSNTPQTFPSKLTLRRLALINGYAESAGGAISSDGILSLEHCTISLNSTANSGGAIKSSGALNLEQCTLSHNSARGSGGAISHNGALTLARCELSQNSGHNGAAINYFGDKDPSSITQCTIAENEASGDGGGIYCSGSALSLAQCTFSKNSAQNNGGAIFTVRSTSLTQCTLSGNSASWSGGAIYNTAALLQLTHCTISGNAAITGAGGGIFNMGGNRITLFNGILAGNTADYGADFHGSASALSRTGVNLIGNNNTYFSTIPAGTPNATGDYVGTSAAPLDPQLAPLGDYGGPTQTMALLPSSFARNHATILSPAITVDQRGFPIIGKPDIGAYETGTTNSFALWSIENSGKALSFSGDSDHDGLPDGLEYATRTNLTAFNSNPLIGPMLGTGSATQLSFPYRADAKDVRYIVQRSTDLLRWTEIYRYDTKQGVVNEVDIVANEDPVTEMITIVDPASGVANFWRMLVELVP